MMVLKLLHLSFPKCEPCRTSLGAFARETFLVILEYKGMQGIGAANPFKPITGDSPRDLVREAKKVKELSFDPKKDSLKKLHAFLCKKIKSKTLECAIDAAYHDLIGKIKGVPVHKLYSKKITVVDNSITVFLKDSLIKTQNEARKIYKAFPDLKILKIKLKGKQDLERVKAIKSVSPRNMKFILDANQGYKDPKEAVRVLTQINKVLKNVLLVEQPCPKHDLKSLKYITDNLKGMLVFADEAAATFEDVKKIVDKKAAHGVNIKLQKAGGIYPATQIALYCKKHWIKVMVGAMIEDRVGLTVDAHFAAANSNVILTDLDTDIDSPLYVKGGSYLKNGQRKIYDRPGFGIDIDIKKLRKIGPALVCKELL